MTRTGTLKAGTATICWMSFTMPGASFTATGSCTWTSAAPPGQCRLRHQDTLGCVNGKPGESRRIGHVMHANSLCDVDAGRASRRGNVGNGDTLYDSHAGRPARIRCIGDGHALNYADAR